jgi:hypothetical protein
MEKDHGQEAKLIPGESRSDTVSIKAIDTFVEKDIFKEDG